MFNIFNKEPRMVARIPSNQLSWEREGILVWISQSQGDLKYVHGYDRKNESKQFLLLNNIPLLKIHANECPTCEQLLSAGYSIDEVDVNIVNRIKSCSNGAELIKDDVVQALSPLLNLLEKGLYLLSYIPHYPTNGEGKCFWDLGNTPKLFKGLMQSWYHQDIPSFLIPTQPISNYSVARMEYYRSKLRNSEVLGGIAYYIDGFMSALLDGHHRAMACLMEGKPLNCLTISRVTAISTGKFFKTIENLWVAGQSISASILPKDVIREINTKFGKTSIIGQEEVEKYLELESGCWNTIKISNENIEAAKKFPTIEGIEAIEQAGELTDENINICFNGSEFDFANNEQMKNILEALIILGDERAFSIAKRVASTEKWSFLWNKAFMYLASFKTSEIEEFFINFLIYDENNRTDIKKIIDDYFRDYS
jgi:hypothetical protein